jgi:hypothetical protein
VSNNQAVSFIKVYIMQIYIITLVLQLFICSVVFAGESFENLIKKEPQISVSDGSSIYTFGSDGRFNLEPAGVSGRSIQGKWIINGEKNIEITGKWGWTNGLSKENDHRTMILSITNLESAGQKYIKSITHRNIKLWKAYLIVEHLAETQQN